MIMQKKIVPGNFYKTCIVILSLFLLNTAAAQDNPALKDVFKNKFLIGAAVNVNQFTGKDSLGSSIVKKHFNSITPENILKWEIVHPLPEKYNFQPADSFVNFGVENNMFIVGHTLVWHSQTPRWVFEGDSGKPATRDQLIKRMKDHITTVVSRYKGKIKGWDVVNEALNEDGSLRPSPWMKIIGEDYIELAFKFAHEADPDAELYYNDYSIENEPKGNGAVKIFNQLKQKGIFITGIGIQEHIKMDWPSPERLDSTINAFASAGAKVMITELDLDVLPYKTNTADVNQKIEMKNDMNPYPNGLPDSVENAHAERYADLFKVYLKNSDKISRITFWGVTDKESWLNNWPIRGRTSYPLLFDRNGNPKKAFNSIIKLK